MGIKHKIYSYGSSNDNGIILPSLSNIPVEIYNLSGKEGYLNSLYLKFNSDDVILNLIVDGIDVFQDLNLEIVDELSSKEDTVRFKTIGMLRDRDVFYYTPTNPVRFKNSLIITARCNKNSNKHKFEKYIIDMELEWKR